MDAVEYIKENKRMCDSIERDCGICKVYEECLCRGDDPEKWVSIVEKWAKEHPAKTRQSEFQKHYPNVVLSHDIIYLCPKWVDKNARVDCLEKECKYCREQYWTEEIEE